MRHLVTYRFQQLTVASFHCQRPGTWEAAEERATRCRAKQIAAQDQSQHGTASDFACVFRPVSPTACSTQPLFVGRLLWLVHVCPALLVVRRP